LKLKNTVYNHPSFPQSWKKLLTCYFLTLEAGDVNKKPEEGGVDKTTDGVADKKIEVGKIKETGEEARPALTMQPDLVASKEISLYKFLKSFVFSTKIKVHFYLSKWPLIKNVV
jgi:hypothetical protein